jgi:prenyltransferase beta subunit
MNAARFNPGKNLYEMYRQNPPAKRGASHVAAYWDGYEGRPNKYVRTSYGWWAYKAGKDNRKMEKCA